MLAWTTKRKGGGISSIHTMKFEIRKTYIACERLPKLGVLSKKRFWCF